MPGQTTFLCPEISCQQMFATASWRPKHTKLHHFGHLQVARQENLTIRSTPQLIEPIQCREFNANKDSVEGLDALPFLTNVGNIVDLESQQLPPPLPQTDK
jgi:hypothetical protein